MDNETNEEDRFFFTDSRGDRWSLRLDWGDLQDLKEHPDIDLDIGRIVESNRNVFEILYGDPIKLVVIATELTRSQRESRSISDREFVGRLIGEVLDDVTRAFVAGLVNCLPKHLRTTLEAAIAKSEIEVQNIATMQADLLKRTPKLSQKLKKKLEAEFDKTIETAFDSG